MIYVILEAGDGGQASARNENIKAQADRDRGKKYGQIVTDRAGVKGQLKTGDRTLCIFAHGNQQVVGNFRDMGALVKHLATSLNAFAVHDGKSIQNLVLNSCLSRNSASKIAGIVRAETLVAGRNLDVTGTRGSAFTDRYGVIRVAKSQEAAKTLDAAVTANVSADRFDQLLGINCYSVAEGLATYSTI